MPRPRSVIIGLVLFLLLVSIPTSAFAQSGGTYLVQPGDTLSGIAVRWGTTVQALMQANGISNPDAIRYGQRLTIPGGSSAGAARSGTTYTVRLGDTLAQIGQRFGVSAAALAAANGISNPDRVVAGTTLSIPSGGGSTYNGPAAPAGGTRFVVSISQQTCYLYRGAAVIGLWRCSTGRAGATTMPGNFHVISKMPRAYGSIWGFWMPYWLGIYRAGTLENGIHGLPYSASTGVKVWQNAVGIPVTYGCVLLDDAAAQLVYSVAYIGMPVTVLR